MEFANPTVSLTALTFKDGQLMVLVDDSRLVTLPEITWLAEDDSRDTIQELITQVFGNDVTYYEIGEPREAGFYQDIRRANSATRHLTLGYVCLVKPNVLSNDSKYHWAPLDISNDNDICSLIYPNGLFDPLDDRVSVANFVYGHFNEFFKDDHRLMIYDAVSYLRAHYRDDWAYQVLNDEFTAIDVMDYFNWFKAGKHLTNSSNVKTIYGANWENINEFSQTNGRPAKLYRHSDDMIKNEHKEG